MLSGAAFQAPVLDDRQRKGRHGEAHEAARGNEHQQVYVRQRLRLQALWDLCASARPESEECTLTKRKGAPLMPGSSFTAPSSMANSCAGNGFLQQVC